MSVIDAANGDIVAADVMDAGLLDYHVQMFLWDIEVWGLLASTIKSVSMTRDSQLHDFRWASWASIYLIYMI